PKSSGTLGCGAGDSCGITFPNILVPCHGVRVVELVQVHGLDPLHGEFLDMSFGCLFRPKCKEQANPVW
ncbi:MAG: hypothetical protein ACKPKO_46450, partial [Candidatus Fonsibacter sp.]